MLRFACATAVLLLACDAQSTPFARAGDLETSVVFQSGANGYHTYRIPALVVTKAGTLLAFCEGRKTSRADHGDLDMMLRRSTDGGRTWLPQQMIYEEGGDATITIGNPCPVVDHSTGDIWLPLCRDNCDVLMMVSRDDGQTWSAPRDITSDVKPSGWTWYATGPGNGIQIAQGPHRGRLVIPCDHRFGDKDPLNKSGRSHVIYSDDHGATWQLGGATGVGMNECAVAEIDMPQPGTLLLNMRSYRQQGCRAASISTDGGLTWSDPVDVPGLPEPVCQGSLVRMTGAQPALAFSNPASATQRENLTVRVSADGGKSWPRARTLHEGPAAYSCLAPLDGATLGCLYEAGEKSAYQTITFARFPLSWVTVSSKEAAN